MAGEDAVSYIFGGNTGLTYEQLKRRRAVALALASQRRGYPKTVGEGMTYLGESIGDMLAERRLDAAEKGYLAKQSATLAGLMPGASSAAPVSAPARPGAAPTPIIPPAAPRPSSVPVRPPPASAAPPATTVAPAPSITAIPVRPTPADPYGATEGTGGGFEPGSILNPAPIAAPGLQEVFPGEEGAREAGGGPSSGYLPPTATAAAPPLQSPAPQATAPPAPVGAMDYASWPHGPIRRPTDTAVEESTAGPTAPPATPAAPAAALGPQSSIQLTPQQRDVLARTIYGEASNQADVGQQAVANVILNRARLAGTAPDYEALKRNQFEPWWNQRARARMERLSTENPAYQRAQAAIDAALAGDPTGGATHFYSPSVQAALGRRDPNWARGEPQMIGTHAFYRLPYGGQQPAPAEDGGGNVRLAAYAPDGGAGAPIPGMGGAGSPRLQPQIPPLQGPPPAPESEQITPTDIMPMPATAQFGPPVGRFSRTDAPVPGVAAQPPPSGSQPPPSGYGGQAPPPPQGPLPGGIPGPLAQPTPVTPAPSLGRQTVPVPPEFNRPLVRPTPPTYPEQPSEYEIRAQRAIAANPGDPAIHEQAKALADFGKAQRDAAYMRQVEEYKKDLDLYNSLSTSREQFIRSTPERELTLRKGEEELAAKAREEERSRRLGGVAPEVLTKQIEESQKNVKNIPAATLAIANANRALLDQNMFTGSSAEMNLSMAKLLKAAGFPGDPRIEATEQFKAYISPIVAQARQAMAGGTNISDRDMMAAERAAAGDIKLERGSIKSVLDSVERINTAMAVDHQKKLLAFTGNDPDAQRVIFGTFGLPMENIVPPAAVQRLRDNASNPQAIREFDDAFKTPGLAQRVLGRR